MCVAIPVVCVANGVVVVTVDATVSVVHIAKGLL